MAGQRTPFQNRKSITGLAFIGLGVLILAGNLVSVAVQLSHLLGMSADLAEELGPLSTASMAVSQALSVYFFDHQGFSRGVQRILISFWPVLLVIAGSVVLRGSFTGKAGVPQKKMTSMSNSLLLVRR